MKQFISVNQIGIKIPSAVDICIVFYYILVRESAMNKSDEQRDLFMLTGPLAKKGYDWWWHNFTGYDDETGEAKSFFIEYYICNPALGSDEPILGQKEENLISGRKPSYAMIKAGTWGTDARQINNFYPVSDFLSNTNHLDITIGENTLSEKHLKGSVSLSREEAVSHKEYMSQYGSMSWDLKVEKKIAFNVGYGASSFFRKIQAFEMYWHAEGIKSEFTGKVTLDGRSYTVSRESSFGYADKNWGRDFTSPWLWLSSCNLRSQITGKPLRNSAVEFGGGKPKIFMVPLNRKILGGLFYEGIMYEYNFSKFWQNPTVAFDFTEGSKVHSWDIEAKNYNSRIVLHVECPVDEMLLINYEAPNGKKLHNRLWNGGTGYGIIRLYKRNGKIENLADRIEIRNAGCEYGKHCRRAI